MLQAQVKGLTWMNISRIRINGVQNPVGFSCRGLRCAWTVTDTPSRKAALTRIEVAADPGFQTILLAKEGAGLNPACEPLDLPLSPRTRFHVRVTVTGDRGDSASGTAFFETGKMEEPWQGRWIKPQPGDTFHPVFRKTFAAPEGVTSARLYISGLGLYSAVLNGTPVSREVLTPYTSDYHTEVQYQTYDITGLLRSGNTLEVELGNGWYKGHFGLDGRSEHFGSEFQMIAEIHLSLADGSREVIPSDLSWQYRGSDTEESDIYNGEAVNRLLWKDRDNPWKTPVWGQAEGRLVDRFSLPVTEHEVMPVREVIHTPAGETVLDFGQNFAGWVSFPSDRLPAGTTVTLECGEILQHGNFCRDNYRRARARFVYTADGRSETVKPKFTFFGFRYVRVSGWPGEAAAEDFTGRALYSDMETIGRITTGNAKVNQLISNTLWGQKSNSIDFPTDCPQRDERLGWTGDAQVFSGTAAYSMDTSVFHQKFLHDLRVEQVKLDGHVPGVIPVFDPDGGAFAAVWGDAATFIPTVLWNHYGDIRALEENYPLMKDWVDRIDREDASRGHSYQFNFFNQMGDWLALDGRTPQSMKGGTDDYFISACYYHMSAKMVSQAAAALGRTEDAARYAELAEKIRSATLREYFTETGRLCVDTQTGYVVALYSGICRDRETVVEGLRNRLYRDCFRMKGGFVGAPIFCKVLADNGMEDEAFYFLTQEEFPGWMHCINLGATTIWERWNSVLDDGTLSGTMMNSLNHFAFGSVVEFLYANAAGIRPLEPGFRRIRIAPQVSSRLGHLDASVETPHGTCSVFWEIRRDGQMDVRITVPFGCTAQVELPGCEGTRELEAGSFRFLYRPDRDLRGLYTRRTLFCEMTGDPRAMEIIQRLSPPLYHYLTSGDEEYLHENLTTLYGMSFMGFPPETIEALAEELTALRSDD